MRFVNLLVLLSGITLLACTVPSAYDRAYERESTRLESQARSDHAEASSYAAVVYFETGSAVVDDDGLKELSWFADKVRPYPKAIIEVRGFADVTGGDAINQKISDERSDNVARQLMLLGIRKAQIVTAGFASEIPAESNQTAKGRKSNRRVEVTVR